MNVLFLSFQTHVSDIEGVLFRSFRFGEVRRTPGYCSGRQQEISIRLSSIIMAGGRKSRSSGSGQTVSSSGLTLHRRPAPEASRLLRESQTDQQRDGQERTGDNWLLIFFFLQYIFELRSIRKRSSLIYCRSVSELNWPGIIKCIDIYACSLSHHSNNCSLKRKMVCARSAASLVTSKSKTPFFNNTSKRTFHYDVLRSRKSGRVIRPNERTGRALIERRLNLIVFEYELNFNPWQKRWRDRNCYFLQLVLNSMHKYQPRIHLVRRREGSGNSPITDLEQEDHKTFIFPESIFTAVTAYQNQLVSHL